MRKLSTCLLIAILGGAFLVGCGSSKTQSTETIATSGKATGGTTSATGSTGSTGSTRSTGSTGTGRKPAPKTAQQRVETCKRYVGALSTLSASTKARAEKNCAKVGASPTEPRKIVQVCNELAGRLPPGLERKRALAFCATQ